MELCGTREQVNFGLNPAWQSLLCRRTNSTSYSNNWGTHCRLYNRIWNEYTSLTTSLINCYILPHWNRSKIFDINCPSYSSVQPDWSCNLWKCNLGELRCRTKNSRKGRTLQFCCLGWDDAHSANEAWVFNITASWDWRHFVSWEFWSVQMLLQLDHHLRQWRLDHLDQCHRIVPVAAVKKKSMLNACMSLNLKCTIISWESTWRAKKRPTTLTTSHSTNVLLHRQDTGQKDRLILILLLQLNHGKYQGDY